MCIAEDRLRGRRDTLSAAGEAIVIEVDGTEMPVTALQVEKLSHEDRETMQFVCSRCGVPVRPWNMGSRLRTPTFRAGHGHEPDCSEIERDRTSASAHGQSEIANFPGRYPVELRLRKQPLRRDPKPNDELNEGADCKPGYREVRGRVPAGEEGSSSSVRLEVAYALGRVVSSWIELGAPEIRRLQSLTLPGGGPSNYLYGFKSIWVKDGKVPVTAYGARIFYADLFFKNGWREDGEHIILTLLPGQEKTSTGNLMTCQLIVDRSGWTTGARNALRREIQSSYRMAREHWNKKSGARVRVFALAEQDANETSIFRVTDPRLVLITDELEPDR